MTGVTFAMTGVTFAMTGVTFAMTPSGQKNRPFVLSKSTAGKLAKA